MFAVRVGKGATSGLGLWLPKKPTMDGGAQGGLSGAEDRNGQEWVGLWWLHNFEVGCVVSVGIEGMSEAQVALVILWWEA